MLTHIVDAQIIVFTNVGPLNSVTFDVLRSVVFFYIKTPLRVKEAGLEELIPTTWWPTGFDKEVRTSGDHIKSETLHNIKIYISF